MATDTTPLLTKPPLVTRIITSDAKFWSVIVLLMIVVLLTFGLHFVSDAWWKWPIIMIVDLICLSLVGFLAFRRGGFQLLDSLKPSPPQQLK